MTVVVLFSLSGAEKYLWLEDPPFLIVGDFFCIFIFYVLLKQQQQQQLKPQTNKQIKDPKKPIIYIMCYKHISQIYDLIQRHCIKFMRTMNSIYYVSFS